MLLFRGTHWDKNLSPEELQNVMSQWTAWLIGWLRKARSNPRIR